MSRTAKWTVTVVGGLGLAGIAFLTVLRMASELDARWTLAAAAAAAAIGLATAIGSSWVSHGGNPPPVTEASQAVSHSRLRSNSGNVIGNARDIHINGDRSQGRERRDRRGRS
ncbi:hypothetical protein GCM10009848_11490 [Micromonospora lupini]